ncbi:OLC1v1023380C1 [Oldenlandia corymbosa var. corymbosa]|uniref:OLC1v1023380C1 n=2 Tax=Oldenlandia corymbosa var. corymbosa TaxID=529605 RepID=A0AAV1C2R8_OLDCO|nr:OLC1v1023380C1 [Oldenlandia corymbosa var. corymbosa]
MGSVLEASILHHVAIVFIVLWLLNSFNYCNPVAYVLSFTYLFLVHERYVIKLRKNLQFEEQRNSNQRRILTDSESVRWLNYAVEKMWPVCMEQIVSQKILLPIVPWFLQKYKPWTVKEALVQHLYLGRSPPMFTEMRVLRQSNNDDHLVLELGMNFRTADDMSAILAVKLKKRLGLGMWAKLHLLGMHIEGKALIGVKFVRNWPFLGRVRLCFSEPPYFQMTVKPIFTHGLDVTELPGIAGWIDKLLSIAFEQTLVEPNMLVVDVEKFASPQSEAWFSIDEKEPVAHAIVEVIEGAEMNPSDLNGLADPYVKGQVGAYRFRTKTQKRTLAPKWQEEFKIPICTWESPNVLTIEVRDKDHFVDDKMGECSVNLNEFRDGQRHDMWLTLQNIKLGRLHLAITVIEGSGKVTEGSFEVENMNDYKKVSFATETNNKDSFSSVTSELSPKVADVFEPINVEGQKETGVWVHHPGSEVAQIWEPKKGKSRRIDTEIQAEGVGSGGSFKSTPSGKHDSSSAEENGDAEKLVSPNRVHKGFQKLGSLFHRRQKNGEKSVSFDDSLPSPHINLKPINSREIGVKFIVDDTVTAASLEKNPKVDGKEGSETGSESPTRGKVKDMAKNILKQSARGIKHALSRKGSNRYSTSVSQDAGRDVSVDSDSSMEESLASVPVEPASVPVTPTSVPVDPISVSFSSIADSGKRISNASENSIPSSNDASIEIEKPENVVIPEPEVSNLKSAHSERSKAVEKPSEKPADADVKVEQ